ncbi:ABC-type Fe3+-hydroxamate transport system, periplasmic component [Pseudonocardia sp. Ae168_Ps1]|uniref:ABC transporter substrate-binding protein n=1 Tax=unclassified Pseudonocardia TaxID=2619320 RepID=UPI00094AAB49|nr:MULTISPECIES: ABC transporter substrate-binding protein [unclassified Pseudonocardia]OLL74483.1 ABC-type Fe3+-hydroxamate transport system, periplasmic component [Pseudonocardia sp. Ae150A_Ps1]OLL80463.1 ABC-type Fe3+-hydroxamate transport system, periplasmic component [Pseudonocardia sp. Ae168_Ps1]OLL85410.1 ABC-type Fe3+-hydroxamate transport system, periplasmic component [Pseudonocardia sp. Ae263_Ps1]OLL94563.1 ABC-type Fe3+-hydroxamate transport system, periplasmic component [Pseudonocar
MPGSSTARALAAASLAVLLGLVAGCGSGGGGGDAEASGPRTITTDRGPLEVPSAPQRVVNLNGGLASYLYALDVPPVATDTRVLGVTNFDGGFPPAWADRAREAGTEQLPAGDSLSIEAVAAAQPDLIIGGGQGITAVQAMQAYDQLAAIAPTVLVPRTLTGWQDQLDAVADAVNKADAVPALLDQYQAKLDEVKGQVTPPAGETVYIGSFASEKLYLIPSTAALPALGQDLGVTPSDVVAKVPDARLASTGDSMEVSPELLSEVANAPNAIVVDSGGRSLDELKQDPNFAQLPAFRSGNVWELPATSYRPDFDGVLSTLDEFGQIFPRQGG